MHFLFISVPRRLDEPPQFWSPDIAWEMAVYEAEGHNVTFIDNALYRFNINTVAETAEKVNPDKIVLYGGLDEYAFIKQYLSFFKDAYVLGFPKELGLIDSSRILEFKVPFEKPDEMPPPAWHLIPLNDYAQNVPPPTYSFETALSVRRGILKTCWSRKCLSPKRVAETLIYLKLKFNFDYLCLDDDLTLNPKRTSKLLKILEGKDLAGLYPWTCKAKPEKVTYELLRKLREAGCVSVDYGAIDVTEFSDPWRSLKIRAAIEAAKRHEITPQIKCTIGHPETKKQDLINALSFLKTQGLVHKPEIIKPYPRTELYEKIKDKVSNVEDLILKINTSFVNYTKWSDIELLGITELFRTGDLEKLEKIREA
jgi:hypothetical protein